jgi:hypothetical protein
MRLPLQHAPPPELPPRMRCEYLTRLLRAAVGLPLGPAAALVASSRSRGRHGNALQWHLGLEGHDARSEPDWEGRIEVKLVTVTRQGGAISCDKLKVCDANLDPWRKLANVLFVLADRLTRTVVGHRLVHLDGAPRAALVRAWDLDPHFGAPDLFVESRESEGVMSPAYYVSSAWLLAHVVPSELPGVFEAPRRQAHAGDPVLTVLAAGAGARCPRCGAPLRFDADVLARHGCAPAHHGMPLPAGCGARQHVVVACDRLCTPALGGAADQHAALHGLLAPDRVARLAEQVGEPDDHGHE